jgi:hypothetical protein
VITVQFPDGASINVPPPAASSDVEFPDMPEMPEDAATPNDASDSNSADSTSADSGTM